MNNRIIKGIECYHNNIKMITIVDTYLGNIVIWNFTMQLKREIKEKNHRLFVFAISLLFLCDKFVACTLL